MDIFKKKLTRNNVRKGYRILTCIIFIAVLCKVFTSVTYLFRNSDYNREHIIGIKEEEQLDMVYIGGSAAFVYWQPLKAWNDCGFTSYDYATSTIQAENIEYYIREVLKTQSPELFVIDARPFQYWDGSMHETGLRNGTDGMDILSVNRYNLVYNYLKTREEGDISYYVDIMKYHTNVSDLKNPERWNLIDNRIKSIYKGGTSMTAYQYVEKPTRFATCNREELLNGSRLILNSLLEYCTEENLNVLFVVCPYQITEKHYGIYNTIGDIVKEYGFDFLNTNDYFEEMGVDFSTDFYNGNHVNIVGAEKYTAFLEKYLVENYDLPDHRGDEAFKEWDDCYESITNDVINAKTIVYRLQKEVYEGKEIADEMLTQTGVSDWLGLAIDTRFTLFVAQQGEKLQTPMSMLSRKSLMELGINIEKQDEYVIRVVSGEKTDYTNEIERDLYMEQSDPVGVSIKSDVYESSICIDTKEYSLQNEGWNIVVYDNNFKKVVDSVTIQQQGDELILIR